jgi:hypothetical protein
LVFGRIFSQISLSFRNEEEAVKTKETNTMRLEINEEILIRSSHNSYLVAEGDKLRAKDLPKDDVLENPHAIWIVDNSLRNVLLS